MSKNTHNDNVGSKNDKSEPIRIESVEEDENYIYLFFCADYLHKLN